MGLFRTIVVEDPDSLPEFTHEDDEVWWQSKSIGYAMETYKITEDGRLYRQQEDYEYVDAPEDHPLDQVREVVDSWWVDHNHHGSFEFHGTFEDGTRYSYEARFTKGDLVDLVLLNKTTESFK